MKQQHRSQLDVLGVNPGHAAYLLSKSRPTILRLCELGLLKSVKIGKHKNCSRLISMESIRALLERGEIAE